MRKDRAYSFTVDELRSLEDPSFLNHKVRKDSLKPPKFIGVLNGRTAHFKAPSSKNDGSSYDVYIMFPDMAERAISKGLSAEDVVDLVIDKGDVKVSCSCPAFLFWGYKYIDTTLDSVHGNPEKRFPKERNPKERGVFCKHIGKCLDHLNWTKYEVLKPPFIEYVQAALDSDKELEENSDPINTDELIFDAEKEIPSKPTPTEPIEPDNTPGVGNVSEEPIEGVIESEAEDITPEEGGDE